MKSRGARLPQGATAWARHLEMHGPPPLAARLLATAWSAVSARGVVRPLALPRGAHVIGVGGATLGGSCKTPLAIALAEALSGRGHDVALVGHAYLARPGRARIVVPHDDVAEVGDDALWAARRLAGTRVRVIVAPTRQASVDLAAGSARIIVVDGLVQTRPARLARALLVLDAEQRWGNGYCPPAGDLRAPPAALVAASDAMALVRDDLAARDGEDSATPVGASRGSPELAGGHATTAGGVGGPAFDVAFGLDAARHAEGVAAPLSRLQGSAIGLVLAVARPQRIVQALARRGIRPSKTVLFPDHHRPGPEELALACLAPAGPSGIRAGPTPTTQRIDVWLTTGKCSTKLPSSIAGAPVLILQHGVPIPEPLLTWADDLFPSAGAVG